MKTDQNDVDEPHCSGGKIFLRKAVKSAISAPTAVWPAIPNPKNIAFKTQRVLQEWLSLQRRTKHEEFLLSKPDKPVSHGKTLTQHVVQRPHHLIVEHDHNKPVNDEHKVATATPKIRSKAWAWLFIFGELLPMPL
jgi:hypothetical protein